MVIRYKVLVILLASGSIHAAHRGAAGCLQDDLLKEEGKSSCLQQEAVGSYSPFYDYDQKQTSSDSVIVQPSTQQVNRPVASSSDQSCCDTLQTVASGCVGAADSCCTSLEDLCFGKSDQSH